MKKLIKMLAVAGLMSSGLAYAAVPADFSAAPGVLFVKWHGAAAQDGQGNAMLEVRDGSGELLASVPAKLAGTQQVRIPRDTQGSLTVSLGDQTSDYHIPFGMGRGQDRDGPNNVNQGSDSGEAVGRGRER